MQRDCVKITCQIPKIVSISCGVGGRGRGVMRGQYGHTGQGIPTDSSLLLAIPYQSETQRDGVKITRPTLSLKMVSIAYGIGEG